MRRSQQYEQSIKTVVKNTEIIIIIITALSLLTGIITTSRSGNQQIVTIILYVYRNNYHHDTIILLQYCSTLYCMYIVLIVNSLNYVVLDIVFSFTISIQIYWFPPLTTSVYKNKVADQSNIHHHTFL